MSELHHHHHDESCCCHHDEGECNHDTAYPNRYEQAFAKYDLHVHDEQVAENVHQLLAHHSEENRTSDVERCLLSLLDVTSLRVTDTEESILALVEKLNTNSSDHPELPAPAALCVYPTFASLVSKSLEVEDTAIACVAGGFPSSQMLPEVKTIEVSLALKDGATEIDTVLPVGLFLSENYEEIDEQMDEIKAICGENLLKVILETGALGSASAIKRAAIMAMYCGADFVKTSTGKIEPGATPEAVYVMCQAIREYFDITSRRVGIKVAGGISSIDDAITYYTIVKELLGKEWLTPEYFRIGTSRLYDQLVTRLSE